MSGLIARRGMMMGSRGHNLPTEYQEVEWLQNFSGSSYGYINISVIFSQNAAFYAKIQFLEDVSDSYALGAYEPNIYTCVGLGQTDFLARMGNGTLTHLGSKDNNWHDFYVSPTIAKVDDRVYEIATSPTLYNEKNFSIGRMEGYTEYRRVAKCRISQFRAYLNGVETYCLIPCYRKKISGGYDKIGMYDIIKDSFFEGIGYFRIGPEVN